MITTWLGKKPAQQINKPTPAGSIPAIINTITRHEHKTPGAGHFPSFNYHNSAIRQESKPPPPTLFVPTSNRSLDTIRSRSIHLLNNLPPHPMSLYEPAIEEIEPRSDYDPAMDIPEPLSLSLSRPPAFPTTRTSNGQIHHLEGRKIYTGYNPYGKWACVEVICKHFEPTLSCDRRDVAKLLRHIRNRREA